MYVVSKMSIERKSDGSIVLPRSMGISIGIGAPIGGQHPPPLFSPPERRGIRGVSRNLADPSDDSSKAVELPESRLHIPSTRSMTVNELFEERCKFRPKKQTWGAAWIDYAPATAPAEGRTQFTVVFLDVFGSKARAERYRTKCLEAYSDRPLIIFRVGHWIVLPVPQWLDTDDAMIAYNRCAIVNLMKKDVEATVVKHEIIKRRQKRSHLETSYLTPEEETAKLESGGDTWVPPTEKERAEQLDDYKSPWINVSRSCTSKYKYGLAWVLPEVQNPGHRFEHVAFSWLGAFKTEGDVDSAQKTIRKQHPEWNVTVLELGKPVTMPIPLWLMQLDRKVVYDQPFVEELMSQVGTSVSPEDMDAELKQVDFDSASGVVDDLVGDAPEEMDEVGSDVEVETTEMENKETTSMTITMEVTKKK